MLTVETTDVDPEGNETIWFGGKVAEFLRVFSHNNDVLSKFA